MGDLVTEDQAESAHLPPSRPGVSGVMGVVAGIAIGVAGSFLFGAFDEPTDTSGVTVPPEPMTTGELLPEFEAGVTVIAGLRSQALEFVEWPPAALGRPIEQTQLPFGDLGVTVLPTLDVSGHFIAVSVPLRATNGGVLHVGPVGAIGTVGSNVTGYAWHDSTVALLAFSTEQDGEIGIWTLDGSTRSEHNLTHVIGLPGARLVAFGDWGFALQHDDEVVVINQFGEIVRILAGEYQDSHPDGWLLLRRDGQPVRVTPDGLEESVQLGEEVDDVVGLLDNVGNWWASGFAPDPGRVALLGSRGLALVEPDGIAFVGTNSQRPFLAVGSGYLAYPREAGGVVMVDLETGADFELLIDSFVRAIAILPPAPVE